MPKSYYQLGIISHRFFDRFSDFITKYNDKKEKENRDNWYKELAKVPNDFYADYHGREAITYHCNGDIPFLWICLYLCQQHGIKHKLARYQVRAICDLFKIKTDLEE